MGPFMGSIIREDTEGEPSAVLTETGKGGFLSQGYLSDAPAREYIGDGETAVFVLSNGTGVERERDGDCQTIRPGKKYRAITVVTDRRLIILVGNAADGGDKRVTLPLVEVEFASGEDEALVVAMTSGVTWHWSVDASRIEEVAEYVDSAAEAWRTVETTLDAVKRSIVAATGHRDDGEYEQALDTMSDARSEIENVQERIASFGSRWSSEAMVHRVGRVHDRCLATVAEIRVGYARATVDEGEEYWREGAYDRARDAFEDAREAFEAVQSLALRHRRHVDDIDRAIDRLERSIERLDDAPLRNAIDADRRARETDPSLAALDALAEARERYNVVLDLDPGTDERRFAGDRDRIREQREDVTDRFVEMALELGSDALGTGQWYRGTDQEELAEDELDRAVTVLERGLPVAKTERPGTAAACQQQLSKARDALTDLRGEDGNRETTEGVAETADSDDPDSQPVDAGDSQTHAPQQALETDSTAADGGVTANSDASGRTVRTGSGEGEKEMADGNASIERSLRQLSRSEFDEVVTAVVEATGWQPEPTASTACDYLATRDGDSGTLAVRALPNEDDEPIDPDAVLDSVTLAASVPNVDRVMIVTTRPMTDDARAAARSQGVRILDIAFLAQALAGPAIDDCGSVVQADEH